MPERYTNQVRTPPGFILMKAEYFSSRSQRWEQVFLHVPADLDREGKQKFVADTADDCAHYTDVVYLQRSRCQEHLFACVGGHEQVSRETSVPSWVSDVNRIRLDTMTWDDQPSDWQRDMLASYEMRDRIQPNPWDDSEPELCPEDEPCMTCDEVRATRNQEAIRYSQTEAQIREQLYFYNNPPRY